VTIRWSLRSDRTGRSPERGQGIVEFALIMPVFLVFLLGILEFGMAFTHNLTLEYATREGARVGSALVNGGGTLGCGAGQSPNKASVDPLIIAAVERVLTSPGSAIQLANVPTIRIYKATATGAEAGPVDIWTQTLGAGPIPPGGTQALNFSLTSTTWQPCSRSNSSAGTGPESIGVSLTYSYRATTGLTMPMSDKTVMSLNPTNQ
jgi:TadE-like protein